VFVFNVVCLFAHVATGLSLGCVGRVVFFLNQLGILINLAKTQKTFSNNSLNLLGIYSNLLNIVAARVYIRTPYPRVSLLQSSSSTSSSTTGTPAGCSELAEVEACWLLNLPSFTGTPAGCSELAEAEAVVVRELAEAHRAVESCRRRPRRRTRTPAAHR